MIIEELVKKIIEEPIMKKYLYRQTWLSGSSTLVYPTTIDKKRITFQLSTDKNLFTKFINRIVIQYEEINEGYFWKSDGSCPSTITFYLK